MTTTTRPSPLSKSLLEVDNGNNSPSSSSSYSCSSPVNGNGNIGSPPRGGGGGFSGGGGGFGGIVTKILNSVPKGTQSRATQFKLLLLVLMVLQNSSTVLVGRYTRSGANVSDNKDDLYDVSNLVMVIEITKLLLSCSLEMYSTHGQLWLSLRQHVWSQPWDALKIAIPAVLYLIQNTLLYVALSNLTAPIFQVTYQAKLVTTAVVSVLMLNRQYNKQQWVCLVTLSMGVAVSVLSEQKVTTTTTAAAVSSGTDLRVGLTAVSVACLSSALAGVYYEKILKRKNNNNQDNKQVADHPTKTPTPEPSLWMRNIQLAFFSVIIALGKALLLGSSSSSSSDNGSNNDNSNNAAGMIINNSSTTKRGYLHGFNGWVWLLVGLQAGGGILVAAVIKYADNVLKGLATGVSVVLATSISTVLFGTPLSGQFCVGAVLILASVYFFSNPLPPINNNKNNNNNNDGVVMNQRETERMLPR